MYTAFTKLHPPNPARILSLFVYLFVIPWGWSQEADTIQSPNKLNEAQVHPHYLCLEHGIFDRGVLGISYYSNVVIRPQHSFISTFISAGNKGIRIIDGSNFYSSLGLAYNRGKGNYYFTTGLQLKYAWIYYWNDIDWSVSSGNFSGFTYGGFVGGTVVQGNFFLQGRLSYTRSFQDVKSGEPWYNLGRNKLSALGLGLTLGWNLKSKKRTNKTD